MDPDMAVTRSHCDGDCGWDEIPEELLPYYHAEESDSPIVQSTRGHGHSHGNNNKVAPQHDAALAKARQAYNYMWANKSGRSMDTSTEYSRKTIRTVTTNGVSHTTVNHSGGGGSTPSEEYKAMRVYPLDAVSTRKSALRRSVTPVRNMSAHSQARIARAKLAADGDARTNYTYAATGSYARTGGDVYDSPQMCRVPLRHHEHMNYRYAPEQSYFSWLVEFFSSYFTSSDHDRFLPTPPRNVQFEADVTLDEDMMGPPTPIVNESPITDRVSRIVRYSFFSVYTTIISILSIVGSTTSSAASSAGSSLSWLSSSFLSGISSMMADSSSTSASSSAEERDSKSRSTRRITRSTVREESFMNEKSSLRICGCLPLWLCLLLLLVPFALLARTSEEDRAAMISTVQTTGGAWVENSKETAKVYYGRTQDAVYFIPTFVGSSIGRVYHTAGGGLGAIAGEARDWFIIIRSSSVNNVKSAIGYVVDTVVNVPSLLPRSTLPSMPQLSAPSLPSLPVWSPSPSPPLPIVIDESLRHQLSALTVRLSTLESKSDGRDEYALKSELEELRVLIAQLRRDIQGHDVRIEANSMDLKTAIEEWTMISSSLRQSIASMKTHMETMNVRVTNFNVQLSEKSDTVVAPIVDVPLTAEPALTDEQIAQLVMLPTLLARLDALDSSIDARLAASLKNDKLTVELREQQDAFVDLRQQVVSLGAKLLMVNKDSATLAALVKSTDELRAQQTSFTGHVTGSNNEDVMAMIRAALATYDADKTGRVDYALESAGGHIVSTRCTKTYSTNTRKESVFGIPLWYSNYSPRTIIQRKSTSLSAGECWAMEGAAGSVLIALNGHINVTAITYEHLPLRNAPDGQLESAPKHMELWGYHTEHDEEAVQLADVEYDVDGASMQTFELDRAQFPAVGRAFPMVEWRILSNHGNPSYTCMYRVRVHGHRHYPHYGREYP